MAYINVAEWTPDQVTDWLKGLDDSMYSYVYSFTNNEVGGRQLLNIRPYELEQLGMHSIGHQEIVLEAVENLRNFHYNLDKDNLQFMALHVATAARSLHRQLAIHCDASNIETQMLNDITRTIGTIKPLISWLERSPFHGQFQFTEICRNMLRLGLEMATIAHRDRFVERPVEQIRGTAEKLERLANYIIQDITDPMLLQPASLNLVTLKKRESELGFNIESNYHGIHRVTDIKYNSPAHNSGKIEDGDEIVQINYQTVVGWRYKTVLLQLHESLPDMVLTLKKRPKHTKIYGQIYMQPYRLPSKKRAIGARWGENIPSPRASLLTVPDGGSFNIPLSLKGDAEKTTAAAASSDEDSSCSDIMTPTDPKAAEKEIRLYYPKPRAMLQRRNTICGDEMQSLKCVGGLPLWHERKTGAAGDPVSPSLRDKSVSFGFGLEIAPRPTTCIGIATGASKFGSDVFSSESKKLKQVPEILAEESESYAATSKSIQSKPGVSKVVRFDADMKVEDYRMDEKYTCNVQNTILETFEPIPFADDEEDDVLDALRNTTSEKSADILEALDKASRSNGDITLAEAINIPIIGRRGRLDKSHSTPAYDNSGEESDPPAIEPRKDLQTPPVPPPRPRKSKEMQPLPPVVPPPPPKSGSFLPSVTTEMKTCSFQIANGNQTPLSNNVSVNAEASELHTPTKTRTLTLKKKHSLVAKRRNINLKLLGTGEIQGHLYRRTKDRRGVTFWARLYFVMLDTILYGFRMKEAPKASCVIFLPGFTVSLAKEVHSKPFAFKVYHSAKTFYFAAESQDALNQWVEFIGQAALHPSTIASTPSGSNSTKHLFSETDSSGEETESMVAKNLCTPSPQAQNLKDTTAATPTTATKHDRRYLGSLRKLTKGSLPFKSSSNNDKKASSDIPVPTDQYRSYRKVPGGSFGIQIGTNTPGYHDALPLSLTFAVTPAECIMPQRKHSLTSSSHISNSVDFTASMCLGPPSSPAPPPNIISNAMAIIVPPSITNTCSTRDNSFDSPTKAIKKIPHNFIHASNPNLVEFDFQTSKTLDYSLPKINPSNSWDAHQNIQGFVTLKDLMLQKQEEEAQEMYNNRVLLGVEKKDALRRAECFRHQQEDYMQHANEQKHQQQQQQQLQQLQQQQQQSGGNKMSQTQCRSLPRTPDYEISFKPDDENIRRTRTKEGLKLRDFGYELISGDEPMGRVIDPATRQNSNTSTSSVEHQQHEHSWTAAMKTRQFLKSQQFLLSTNKAKKHSSNSCSSTSSADFGEKRPDSFRKKGKLEAFKTSSERIFQFNKHTERGTTAMTMTLPLNKKYDGGSSGRIKKSHTYNNDLKENVGGKYEAHRKNSAPMPIFSKLSFSSSSAAGNNGNSNNNNNNNNTNNTNNNNNTKTAKEKRLLGSPLLHRTIFGSQHGGGISIPATPTYKEREYDTEIFSQVILPKVPNSRCQESNNGSKRRNLSLTNANITAPDAVAPPPPISSAAQNPTSPPLSLNDCDAAAQSGQSASNDIATPEYPNMLCPPVFEPEIYSLTDPKTSMHLLLRRNNSDSIAEEK